MTVQLNQQETKYIETLLVSSLPKNSDRNDSKELRNERVVATNNLSMIFISVPKFSIILTNLLEPDVGIKEKLAKNIAVTIAEKDNEADIISVKFFKSFGVILR
ncbi:hypothetical protein AF69_05930 [Streptococcus uberis 6736]|nr:hypothetical protein AF69_05930 [Streptococcus uberis 6736]